MKRFICILILLIANNSYCFQIKEVDPYQKINVTISDHEFNRISVENDRIANIFSIKNNFYIETDEINGQIFLGLKKENENEDHSITIVTEKGITQDILLIADNVPAETIIFKACSGESCNKIFPYSQAKELHNENEQMIGLLKNMVKNQGLEGYLISSVTDDLSEIKNNIEIKLERTYKGRFIGEVYQIENKGNVSLKIKEEDFLNSNKIKMILLLEKELDPGKKSILYVVKYA